MFTVKDLADLARAGYKPADVKDIIKAANEVPPQPEPQPEPPKEEESPKEPEVDYKALYEKSQEDLKKAQAANNSRNVQDSETEADVDDLADIFRSYM